MRVTRFCTAVVVWLACSNAIAQQVWMSHGGGFSRYDIQGNLISHSQSFSTPLQDLALSQSGHVWGISSNSLFEFDQSGVLLRTLPSPVALSFEEVSLESVNGTLWLTGINRNVFWRVDEAAGTSLSEVQTAFTGTADILFAGGAVWTGTYPGSLRRYSETGTFLGFVNGDGVDIATVSNSVVSLSIPNQLVRFGFDGQFMSQATVSGFSSGNEICMESVGNELWVTNQSLTLYRFSPSGLVVGGGLAGSETDILLVPSPSIVAILLVVGSMGVRKRGRHRSSPAGFRL